MKTNLLIILSLLLLAATTSQAQPYLAALSKPSYDIENGKLVIRSWLGTLKTNIDADRKKQSDNYYIITNNALKKYKINNIMKQFKIIIFIVIIFALVQFFLLYYIFFKPSRAPLPSSNKRIIKEYSERLKKDSLFLNQVAEAFDETNFKDTMAYSLASYDGGAHRLRWQGRDYTDTFPKIRDIIKNRFPNAKDCYYDFLFINKMIIICIRPALFNKQEYPISLLYSKKNRLY